MATVFTEEFEGGANGAAITTANTAFTTISGACTFDSSLAIGGTRSAKCTGDGATAAFMRHTFTSTSLRYFRRYFRMTAYPTTGNTLPLMRLRNGSTSVTTMTVTAAGLLQCRNDTTIVSTSTTTLPLNGWFRLEWQVNFSGSSQAIRIFTGANVNGTTPTETISGAFTISAFDRAEDGATVASYVGVVNVDDVIDNDSTWPGPASVNTAPTANAGPNQSVATGSTVTLDGTGSSDPDGTIASYAWTQISGTSVTLSSSSVAQPTFTAPGSAATLVFGLIVTDNLGLSSSQSTVTITVGTSPPDFTENFNTGPNGTAITTGNTGYSSIQGTAGTFDSSTRINGSFSGKFTSSGSGSFGRHQFTSTGLRYFRRYFRISAFPASGAVLTICRLRLTSSTVAQVDVNADGVILIKNGSGTTVGKSENTPLLNRWFRVEWLVDASGSTQTARLFLRQDLHSTTPTEVLTGAYTGGNFDRAEEGAGTNSFIGTVWVDGVSDNAGAWPGPADDANQLPIANAGPDQTVNPFIAVTLDGTGSSDAEGPVTYVWRQLAGQAVTLSSTTTAQPTFTAPAAQFGAYLTFGLTVTDTGTLESYEDIVAITVNPATDFVLQGGAWVAYEMRFLKSGSWQ